MNNFFKDCKTAEDCKKRYFKLCKIHHPDNGGDAEIFKQISAEFTEIWERLKNVHFSSEKGYHTETEKVSNETPEELKEILSKLATFTDIEIEICGTWIWLTGLTYPIRKELSDLGFRWSKSKRRWYYAKDLNNLKYKKGKSMKQIREMYGSQIYLNGTQKYLTD